MEEEKYKVVSLPPTFIPTLSPPRPPPTSANWPSLSPVTCHWLRSHGRMARPCVGTPTVYVSSEEEKEGRVCAEEGGSEGACGLFASHRGQEGGGWRAGLALTSRKQVSITRPTGQGEVANLLHSRLAFFSGGGAFCTTNITLVARRHDNSAQLGSALRMETLQDAVVKRPSGRQAIHRWIGVVVGVVESGRISVQHPLDKEVFSRQTGRAWRGAGCGGLGAGFTHCTLCLWGLVPRLSVC